MATGKFEAPAPTHTTSPAAWVTATGVTGHSLVKSTGLPRSRLAENPHGCDVNKVIEHPKTAIRSAARLQPQPALLSSRFRKYRPTVRQATAVRGVPHPRVAAEIPHAAVGNVPAVIAAWVSPTADGASTQAPAAAMSGAAVTGKPPWQPVAVHLDETVTSTKLRRGDISITQLGSELKGAPSSEIPVQGPPVLSDAGNMGESSRLHDATAGEKNQLTCLPGAAGRLEGGAGAVALAVALGADATTENVSAVPVAPVASVTTVGRDITFKRMQGLLAQSFSPVQTRGNNSAHNRQGASNRARSAVKAVAAVAAVREELTAAVEKPRGVWVMAFVDKSRDCGLGYMLSDGAIGARFIDGTNMVLEADGIEFDYIKRASNTREEPRPARTRHKLNEFPFYLKKKVALLKMFRDDLNRPAGDDNPVSSSAEAVEMAAAAATTTDKKEEYAAKEGGKQGKAIWGIGEEEEEEGGDMLTFVEVWRRTTNNCLFRLSDRTVQVSISLGARVHLDRDRNLGPRSTTLWVSDKRQSLAGLLSTFPPVWC